MALIGESRIVYPSKMASFEPWTLCEKGVEVVVLSVVWILALVWSLLTTSFDGPQHI